MAYLQITHSIADENRSAAAAIYRKYKAPFLETVPGAKSKELLVRQDDVQVLHGFDTVDAAQRYLESQLFNDDVVTGLKPLRRDPRYRWTGSHGHPIGATPRLSRRRDRSRRWHP